jgi:hypothetical protein
LEKPAKNGVFGGKGEQFRGDCHTAKQQKVEK